ncbi:hypothetical protein LEP1GSC185_3784 [Leptospira licerasiae serovar Varillal str. VAR 010]|uniref:Uncharacterized protein n=1 Tax=Leptospira licerasiae str. MMD4847 TaxID=1049971 RepID=A0ABN0HDY5_9LEPT|nr:hypothetical protein LEP1GSC185_3784 [Leptospira licerasiae serovar Varillal str. VAR 010]EJZ43895.1 hypothetical protein LEP1GSC178_2109 [Leptospira licerasiae str. MMD4847]
MYLEFISNVGRPTFGPIFLQFFENLRISLNASPLLLTWKYSVGFGPEVDFLIFIFV